jgi:hypothetical protein
MGKIKNITVYCAVPMSRIWAKKYCLDDFKLHGYNLTFLDASQIFFTDKEIRGYALGNQDYLYKTDDMIRVSTFDEVDKYIQTLDDSHIIWMINRHKLQGSHHNYDLEIFNRYKRDYFFGQDFITPLPMEILNRNNKCLFLKSSIRNWKKNNTRRLRYRFNNRPLKPTFIIGTGNQGRIQAMARVPRMGDYLSLPSLNVLWDKCDRTISGKYILYVDEGARFSPDVALLGGVPPIRSPDKFYENMNRVFNCCEDWLGMQVIISAAGKYIYSDNPFDDREIIYGKTSELSQHAELVIGHNSSALEQSIVERKPVLNVLDREFVDMRIKEIRQFAEFYFNQNAHWSNEIKRENIKAIQRVDFNYLEQIEYDYFREKVLTGSFFSNLQTYLSNIK